MNKEQKQIITDAIENLDAARNILKDNMVQTITDIKRELDQLNIVKEGLEEEYENMEEKEQDEDEGQEITNAASALEDIHKDLTELKDEFEADQFEDIIASLKVLIGE